MLEEERDKASSFQDELIAFNYKLNKSGHNIKSYRKKQEERFRVPNSTECTHHEQSPLQTINYVRTLDLSERKDADFIKSGLTSREEKRNTERFSKISDKRISITAGNIRKKRNYSLDTGKSLDATGKMFRNNKRTLNAYKITEKKHNKTPLKECYLENWLNELLSFYQQNLSSSPTTTEFNPNLKVYSIDRNTLLSQGIDPAHIQRIYKALFVYSMGFNSMLNQICEQKMELRLGIWKIFSLLIQYSANGTFETVIGNLQRGKKKMVEKMKKQLQDRQKLLQNHEEAQQQRYLKMLKQNKLLKQENSNLMLQKQTLMQEYKQAEQAFNEQVSLRLQFQNNINEIHGIYTDLKNKYQILHHDFDSKIKQNRKLENLLDQRNVKITQNNIEIKELKNELKIKLGQISSQQGQLKNLSSDLLTKGTEHISTNSKVRTLSELLQEKDKVVEQYKLHLLNVSNALEKQRKQHHETRGQYERSLEENSSLHKKIQDQTQKLSQNMYSEKDDARKRSQLESQVVVIKKQLQDKINEWKECQDQIASKEQEKRQVEIQYQYQKAIKQKHQITLKQCYQKIHSMKIAKNIIQEELEQKKRRVSLFDQLINKKNLEVQQLSKKIQELEKRDQQNGELIRLQESKINLLKSQLVSESEISKKKIHKLREQKEYLQKENKKFWDQKEEAVKMMEYYKGLYDQTLENFKDEVFEHKNLNLKYKLSLDVMADENEHIKKLNIKISELNEDIISMKRKEKSSEFVHQEKIKQFERDRQFWGQQLTYYKQECKKRSSYVNPMIFQDVAGSYHQAEQKMNKQASKRSQEQATYKNSLKKLQNFYEQSREDWQRKEKEYIDKILLKQEESKYTEERISLLESKLSAFASQEQKQKKNVLINEKEELYLQTIKEKKSQIDELFRQLEQSHDTNTNIHLKMSEMEKQLIETKQLVEQLELKLQKQRKQAVVFVEKNKKLEEKVDEMTYAFSANLDANKSSQDDRRGDSKNSSRKQQYEKIKWTGNEGKIGFQSERLEGKRIDFAKKYKGAYLYYSK